MTIKRPALTDDSFLQHLFSPKRHGQPTGLRARSLAATKGRSKARVAAYNRMSPVSQEVLKRSGLREAYLKGESKLSEAKAKLRETAVGRGFARPLKPKRVVGPVSNRRTQLDAFIASHVARQVADAGRGHKLDLEHLKYNVQFLPDDMTYQATRMDYADIKNYGHDVNNMIMFPDGVLRNPLWYH